MALDGFTLLLLLLVDDRSSLPTRPLSQLSRPSGGDRNDGLSARQIEAVFELALKSSSEGTAIKAQ